MAGQGQDTPSDQDVTMGRPTGSDAGDIDPTRDDRVQVHSIDPSVGPRMVAPGEVQGLVRSGKWRLNDTVSYTDAQGVQRAVPAAVYQRRLDQGYSPQLDSQHEADVRTHEDVVEQANSGVGKGIEAAGLGALRGLTLHGSDWLLDKAGVVPYDQQRELQNARPWLSGGGELAGVIAPAVLSGGASAGESAGELGALGAEEAGSIGLRTAARSAADYTPGALIGRAGVGVREALGGGIVGRVAAGGVDNGLYQGVSSLVDGVDGRNPRLSAEGWLRETLEAAALGGGLTAGGIGLAKAAEGVEGGYDKVRSLLGLGDREAVGSMRRFDVPAFESEPYRPKAPPDLTPGTRSETVFNAGRAYGDDLNTLTQLISEHPGGWSPQEITNLRVLRDSYVPRLSDGTLPPEAAGAFLRRLATAEATAGRIRSSELADRLSPRWSDASAQARQASIKDINLAEGTSDAMRINGNVAAHIDGANAGVMGPEGPSVRDSVTGQLNDSAATGNTFWSRIREAAGSRSGSVTGRYAKALGLGIIGAEVAEHGVGVAAGLGHTLGEFSLGAMAAKATGKAARRVFEDPYLSSLAGASAAQVLHRSILGDSRDGSRPASSPRSSQQAMGEYVTRAQAVTPQMASARTLATLKATGVAPAVAFLTSQTAARRQQAILDSLPQVKPRDGLTIQRYTDAQLRTAAAVYRAASDPNYAFHLAMEGRLGPLVLGVTERVFPGTTAHIRSELIRAVAGAGGPGRVSPEVLRTIRTLDGRADRSEYGTFIQASISRGQAKAAGPASPTGATGTSATAQDFRTVSQKLGQI